MQPALESVSFIVWGPPQPKQRARKGARGRWYTPTPTVRFERAVRAVCAVNLLGRKWRLDGLYRLTVRAVFGDHRRRDASNVLKAVEDGLNGVAWLDDSQVVDTHARKSVVRGMQHTEVLIERVGDAPRKARRA